MLYIDEKIGLVRRTVDDGHFSLVGSLMGGKECNKWRMIVKAEEFVPWFFSLTGE